MWSQLILCCLVGLSLARQDPAWKENTEYTYQVRGRSLSSFHEIKHEYTGIYLRANLVVQPQSNDRLRLKIAQPEYAEIQTNLPEGWDSEIHENQLTFQPLEMSSKPFEVSMRNGVVRELYVEQEVPEWEANIIKSFVSLLQLDTKAENLVESRLNVLPKEGSNNAVFKTIEDTVTGITETTYDIHPLPEYILQSHPHLAPFPHLKGDGSIIEIVKNKNYTAGHDLPSYTFGLGNAGEWKPESNQFGQILQRNTLGRAIVTGTLQRYTIQYSETKNQMMIIGAEEDRQEGSVSSMLTMKLTNADQQNSQLQELSSPVAIGSLVYSYEKQESGNNKVSKGRVYQREQYQQDSSEEHDERSNYLQKRHPRSIRSRQNSNEYSQESIESQEEWTEPKAKLNEAPRTPMLPYTTGYKGLSIKYAPGMNIVEKVYTIAQQIGQELEQTQEIPKRNTLSKFVLLSSVLRTLNEQELKQVAQKIYTQETEGAKAYAWLVFRDAVAETGTGPAILLIKDLIETEKIKGFEAGNVIDTMSQAVRQPTEEYINTFYELTKKTMSNQEKDQSFLNETMLFSFANLVNKVYVNKRVSHREYPTHSFGKFSTKQGDTFVLHEFIPYLSKQLQEFINKGDDHKARVIIHAFGILAHEDIINEMEPYLEGKKPCSQFQRFMMVTALHQAAKQSPKTYNPVMYRMYQNPGEITEIRVAAVYILMQLNPSADMLQRMAVYTNMEANHKVCAAVKSAIESASTLKGLEFAELRSAAQSARPYLTKKEFGVADSLDLLYTYASHNWASYYKNVVHSAVSEKSGIPTSYYFTSEGRLNGYRYQQLTVNALLSDIRNLFHVFKHQTQWYNQERAKQQSNQQSEKSSWSSSNIAKLLNIKKEELEQLEGSISLQIYQWRRSLFYNNHTVERIPRMIEELQEALENGKKVRYVKLMNNEEVASAFPTAIGLPFIFTYDFPVFMKVQGTLRAKAEPKISNGERLATPDKADMEGELKVVISGKKRVEFGFVAPFNNRQYSAGYDRNAQIHMPIKAKIIVNFRDQNVEYEVEPLENEQNVNIFHRSSWPYVSIHDILALQPTSESKNTRIIRRRIQNQWEKTYGDKSVGMAFRVKYENDDKESAFKNPIFGSLFGFNSQHNKQSAYPTPTYGGLFSSKVQYENMDVEYIPDKSQNRKLNIKMNYDTIQQQQQKSNQQTPAKAMLEKLGELPEESRQRVSELTKQVSSGMENARVYVYDARAEFSGKQTVQFIASLAYAQNVHGDKPRVLAYVKKQSQISGSKPFEAALSAKMNFAKVNALDVEKVMNSDLSSKAEVAVAYGEKLPADNKIEVHAQFRRSNERKEYLKKLPVYQKCQHEMQQGNKILMACSNVTQEAALFDRIEVSMNGPKLTNKFFETALQEYYEWEPYYHFKVEDNKQKNQRQEGQLSMNVKFYPDLQRANVSVSNQLKYAKIDDIEVGELTRRVVVVHPAYDVIDRIEGQLTGRKTYKAMCSLDEDEAHTFDGLKYPIRLSNYWTVALQYTPLRASEHSGSSVSEQLKSELHNYVVLTRQSNSDSKSKDVKIVVSTPQTEGKVLEVTLKPKSGGNYPQVIVNGNQVQLTGNDYSKIYKEQVTVFALPNNEVGVNVKDAFTVFYDGTRARIDSKTIDLRNRIHGMCGNFDGDKTDDFTTPNNCVVRDHKEFIASYTVLQEGEQDQEIMDLKSRAQKNHCVHKKIPLYVNYIHQKEEKQRYQSSGTCSKYQTRYVMENGKICFTIRPLTVCKSECSQEGSIYKNVEVHCVESKQNVANLWKSQIDKGASPDFSQKPVTKSIQMEMPKGCNRSL